VSRRRLGIAASLVLAAIVALGTATGASAASKTNPPPIKHVFIVVLENEDASAAFGPGSKAPYLARQLTAKGELLRNYYGVAHVSNPNYIAMVSGLGPNMQSQVDCQVFDDFTPGIPTAQGQFLGQGCVYPAGVETIANQLDGAGFSWHAYMQDMNNGAPAGTETPCRHPQIGASDPNQHAVRGDQYATRHNPFVYFRSIIKSSTCKRNDVDLSHLNHDLKRQGRTPNYSFIVPNLCNDGHDEPCVNGNPGGLVSANGFLRRRVPKILHSPAFKDRGLLIVTFDEAEIFGPTADASACCNEPTSPNVITNGGSLSPGPGGGRIGAVLISPCIKPGTVDKTPYNHYSMLRSIEDNFGLPHLGYAGQKGLKPFGSDVFNRPSCGAGTG
jgi:phosphatidylinositol-3-phosphatase